MKKHLALCIIFLASVGLFSQQTNSALSSCQSKASSRAGFIENKGQIVDQNFQPNSAVSFLYLSPGLNIQLKTNGFSYDTYTEVRCKDTIQLSDNATSANALENNRYTYIRNYHRVDVELVGCNPSPQISAVNKADDYLNFYTPATGEGGSTHVHSHEQIQYTNIYPNIDLVFFSTSSSVAEYQFVVHPGGRASDIRLRYKGADYTMIRDNAVVLQLTHGELVESMPRCYLSGSDKSILCEIQQRSNNEYGFQPDAYDARETLIIDPLPQLMWATYYGGSSSDAGVGVGVDQSSNVLMCGYTSSLNQIATSGAYQTSRSGSPNAMVVKFSADGTRQWGTYFGGSASDYCYGFAVDQAGSAIIVGTTTSTTNIASSGAYQVAQSSSIDGYIAKFAADGSKQWSTYYGGNSDDAIFGVAVDNSSNIFVTGTTKSTNVLYSSGAYQTSNAGGLYGDAFVAKFSSSGNRIWGTFFGGTDTDAGYSATCDPGGNVIVTGKTSSTSGIASSGAYQQSLGGGNSSDAFVAKLSSSGALSWSTYFGGDQYDTGLAVAADASSNVVFTGCTASANGIATSGSYQSSIGGGTDAFLAKFSPAGSILWSTYFGGSADDNADNYGLSGAPVGGVCTDANSNIIISGITYSSTNISTVGAQQTTLGGLMDVFLAKFQPNGTRLWATYYGSNGYDYCRQVATNGPDDIYVTGLTTSTSNIATTGAHQTVIAGLNDAFVAHFKICVSPTPHITSTRTTAICVGDTAQYNVGNTAGSSFVWQSVTKGSLLGSNMGTTINVVWNQIGNDTVRVRETVVATGCYTDSVYTITVYPKPAPVITSPKPTVLCISDATGVVYSVQGVAGNIYQWQSLRLGTITSSTTDNSIVVNWLQVGSDTIRVRQTVAATGCYKDTTIVVTIKPAPSVTSISDKTICAGTSIELTSKATGGIGILGYNWLPTNGLKQSNVPSPTASPLTTTRYVLTVSDEQGCTAKDTVIITVLPKPTANAGRDTTLCATSSITLGTSPVKGYRYEWKPAVGLNNALSSQPVATLANSQAYTLTVTDTTTNCSDSSRVLISITKAPIIALASSFTICTGESAQLTTKILNTDAADTIGIRYMWTPPTGLSSTTISNPVAQPLSTTKYQLRTTNKAGCTSVDSVEVKVQNTLNLQLTPDTSVCRGGSIRLQAQGGAIYSWSPTIGLDDPTSPTPLCSITKRTVYTVATHSGNCTDVAQMVVDVFDIPKVKIISDNTSVCVGSPVHLSIDTPRPDCSYTWTNDNGDVLATALTLTIAPTKSLRTFVTSTSAQGCITRDTLATTVDSSLQVHASGATTVCPGTRVKLSASSTTANVVYQWRTESGIIIADADSAIVQPTQSTRYIVRASSGGCQGTDTVTITISNAFSVQAIADTALCSGALLHLRVLNSLSAAQYDWLSSDGKFIGSGSDVSTSPLQSGSYILHGNNQGCEGWDTVLVSIRERPKIIVHDTSVCVGQTVVLHASTSDPRASFEWRDSSGTVFSQDPNPVVSALSSSVYTVTVSDTNGCTTTATAKINTTSALRMNIHIDDIDSVEVGTSIRIPIYAEASESITLNSFDFDLHIDASLLSVQGSTVVGGDALLHFSLPINLSTQAQEVAHVNALVLANVSGEAQWRISGLRSSLDTNCSLMTVKPGRVLTKPICTSDFFRVQLSNTAFLVVPNPAHDELSITSEHPINDLSLWNIMGERVDIKATVVTPTSAVLNVNLLPSGTYTIQLRIDDTVVSKPVMVLH